MNPGFRLAVSLPFVVARSAVAVVVWLGTRNVGGMLALGVLLGFASIASAAEEADVDWKEVRVVSTRHEETGTVIFDARADGRSYKAVSIDVFGKQFKLSEKELSKLEGFPLNSLRIKQSPSYPQIGGYTVYFVLKRVYYTSGELLEDRIVFSVSKGQGFKMREPQTRELQQSRSVK